MNVVRAELETRLKQFADFNSLPLAVEGVLFTKPNPSKTFIECSLLPAHTGDVTVDGLRQRETGVFKVNVWAVAGEGVGEVETVANGIVKAFPLVPKTGLVSVEETPCKGKIMTDVPGWLILPVTISYRYESLNEDYSEDFKWQQS